MPAESGTTSSTTPDPLGFTDVPDLDLKANVFPAEIEELLAGHRDIEEAAAIGVQDDEFGQRLRAFVVLRAGAELDEQQIKDFVRENLARYKAPREVVFVDELPRNPTGKVLKRELAQMGP